MALSRPLQQKLNLPIFRLSFSAATGRFFTSKRCNGDSDNPPPSKKEAAAEGTGITPLEHSVKESVEEKKGFIAKATSFFGLVARYVGSTKSERLSVQFSENKGHQTETKVENEGRMAEAALSDNQNVKCEEVERPLQSDSPKVIRLKSASNGEIDKDNQTETTAENEGRKTEEALSDCQNVSCEGVERSLQSDCSPEALRLKSTSDGSALKIDKPVNSERLSVQFRAHKDTKTKTTAENKGRKDEEALLDYQNERCETVERYLQFDSSPNVLGLKSASDVSAQEIDEPSEYSSCMNLIENSSLNANLQRSDDNVMLNLLDFLGRTPTIEHKITSNSDIKNTDLKDLKICLKVPTVNEDQKQRENTCPARAESVENKVLVRFLRGTTPEHLIHEFFNSCGEILKIEVPSAQGPLFKAAYIDFKTKEGFEKALRKSGSKLDDGTLIVESATAMEEKSVKIPIPGLLGDPDIPSALIKNPTRTIKIEKLTKETSSRHIAEALAFCKSNISGYTLGSSHSVAYVEFESEIGKERALAKQSINVLGRQLVMLRIDCPRTTVVRISTADNHYCKEIKSICKLLGNVNVIKQRSSSTIDVHFKFAEWPNMVKILNGLNGRMVEGYRFQAEPAPVFPPEVVFALWHHPEERKCLETTAQALLHKLTISDTSELASLQTHFFSNI